MTNYFPTIWIPALVGLLLSFYFTSMYLVFKKYLNFSDGFKETVHTKPYEILSYVGTCLVATPSLSFVLYIYTSLAFHTFLKDYSVEPMFLYFLTASLAIGFLMLARTAGANGLTWIASTLHYIVSLGISGWMMFGIIGALNLFNVSLFSFDVPSMEFMISFTISGIIALSINEFLLWLQINKNIEIFKNISPTLPILNLFSRVAELKNYVGRTQLINHVKELITKSDNGTLEISWVTGTLDKEIQRSICRYLFNDSRNNVRIRILCSGEMYEYLQENLIEDFKDLVQKNRINIQVKPFDAGFWREIKIGDKVVCGLTTGDKLEARTGFDAIRPLDILSIAFFEFNWSSIKSVKTNTDI